MNEAERAKKKAMDDVERAANERWKILMLQLTHEVCLTHVEFTSDDVMDRYYAIPDPDKPRTHELRAMGPVILNASRQDWCEKANCAPIPSRRRSLHASPRVVWKSLIRQEGKR